MKLPSKFLACGLALLTTASLQATVTLVFSTVPNFADGFRKADTTVATGAPYAIVVDTADSNNGDFSAFTAGLAPIDLSLAANGVSVGGSSRYVLKWGNTATPPVLSSAGSGGTLGTLSNVPFADLTGGDKFGVIWFPSLTAGNLNASAGTPFGFLADPGFVLPSDGGTSTFSGLSVFAGTGNFLPLYTVVPEPSTLAAVFGVAAVALAILRRRA